MIFLSNFLTIFLTLYKIGLFFHKTVFLFLYLKSDSTLIFMIFGKNTIILTRPNLLSLKSKIFYAKISSPYTISSRV